MRFHFKFSESKMNDRVYLTKEGREKLTGELGFLLEEKRPKVVERLTAARMAGDLSENNDYATAKEELEFLDNRIADLQEILACHEEIIESNKSKKSVCLGCRVTVKNGTGNQEFCVVGEWEADPANKKISHTSPLGKALLGKCPGDEIEIEAPAGKIAYKILKIK